MLLLRRLGDHFDSLRVEDPDFVAVAVKHFEREHEMLPLVAVRNEQRLRRAVMLQRKSFKILHFEEKIYLKF